MASPPTSAVLGFRPHTYWTPVVVLAGPARTPQVLERRRLQFATGNERGAYHHAAEGEAAAAQGLIDGVRAAVTANTQHAVSELVADLQRDGVKVTRVVAPTGTAKLPERLEDILAVHARMHGAEGNFYRDVVADGCAAAGLEVTRLAEKDLAGLARERLGLDAKALEARLKAMGAALGPPWSEDYRLATLAAWVNLD